MYKAFLKDCAAGTAAGITGTFVGYPLDTVKVSKTIVKHDFY